MFKVIRVDSNGLFIEDVLLEEGQEIPQDCVSILVPDVGFYLPKWNGTIWVEGKTQAEIDAIKNVVPPKSELELLRKQVLINQGALDFIVMNF